jgi:light-harvesting complex 1 beta chain
MSSDHESPLNYLTESEAKEVHKLFILSMGFFTLIAIIAHMLVWAWRPWFPGTEPYNRGMAMIESGTHYAQALASTLFA